METKTARELYSKEESNYFTVCDYQPIVDSFGTVLIQEDDDDYQGDSRILLESEGRYGLLIFGWGSCSGCDALQSCGNYDEVDKLIDEMRGDVKWFGTKADVNKYVTEKDWELEWSWQAGETRKFVERVTKWTEAMGK